MLSAPELRPSSSSSSSTRSDNSDAATIASKSNYRSVTLPIQHVETAQGQGSDETDEDEEDGGISYIDPSMLLTQSSQMADTTSSAVNHRSASHSFGFNNSNSNNNSNATAAVRPEIDLFESISRVKRGTLTVPSSTTNTIQSHASTTTSSTSSSLFTFSQEGIRKTVPPSAVAFSWNAKSIAPKPEPTSLSQSTKPTHKPSRSISMNTSPLHTSSTSSSSSSLSSSYPINATTTQLLNDTQQALGTHAYRAFEEIIRRMNTEGGQGIDILACPLMRPS